MDDQAMIRTYGNTDLPEGTPDRPLVSFALLAYNQEKYIRDAVEGAFSQSYSPLEIILSDDCSCDQTYEIMEHMAREYKGPHLVKVRRGTLNDGLISHINSVHGISNGEIIVLAAGDDVSLPSRTCVIAASFSDSTIMAACSAYELYQSGEVPDQLGLEKLKYLGAINHALNLGGVGLGATYAYRSSVFKFPDYVCRKVLSEDRVLPLRASLMGRVVYLPYALIKYRTFTDPVVKTAKIASSTPHNNQSHLNELVRTLRHALSVKMISSVRFWQLLLGIELTTKIRRLKTDSHDRNRHVKIYMLELLMILFRATRRLENKFSNFYATSAAR